MESWCGKTGRYMIIGEFTNEGVEDEGIYPFLVFTLVQNYPHADGVNEHKPRIQSLEREEQYEPPN